MRVTNEGDDWKMDDRCGVKIRSHRVGSDRIFRSADKIRSLIIHSTDRREMRASPPYIDDFSTYLLPTVARPSKE
jgi:hypothetical protein